MGDFVLHTRRLSKSFGSATALDRFELSVRPGELLALVGPSGSGKSTALHVIAGLTEADEGEVRLHNVSLAGMAPGKRDVALVFQDGALYPHLTVAENLGFPLKARGKWGQRAVQHMAERLHITHLLRRYPSEISGGERQRVALGRALIRKPKLFLLDEPLSSLDLPLRDRMRTLIRELVSESGVATIYVTHDQAEAMAVGDRIAVMRAGRVIQVDTPKQIYRQPAHQFVGAFFGNPPMNLLSGRARKGKVSGSWGWLPCPADHEGKKVICGFRPEETLLAKNETGLAAVLLRVDYCGHECIAVADLLGDPVRLRLPHEAATPPLKQPIHLSVAADKLHWFDAESGTRL